MSKSSKRRKTSAVQNGNNQRQANADLSMFKMPESIVFKGQQIFDICTNQLNLVIQAVNDLNKSFNVVSVISPLFSPEFLIRENKTDMERLDKIKLAELGVSILKAYKDNKQIAADATTELNTLLGEYNVARDRAPTLIIPEVETLVADLLDKLTAISEKYTDVAVNITEQFEQNVLDTLEILNAARSGEDQLENPFFVFDETENTGDENNV